MVCVNLQMKLIVRKLLRVFAKHNQQLLLLELKKDFLISHFLFLFHFPKICCCCFISVATLIGKAWCWCLFTSQPTNQPASLPGTDWVPAKPNQPKTKLKQKCQHLKQMNVLTFKKILHKKKITQKICN